MSNPYSVSCWKCSATFEASSSTWCLCESRLLTLVCSRCGSCFCAAPAAYKARFWNDAPASLREHEMRFRAKPAKPAAPEAPSARNGKKVLIVDDEEPMRSYVACLVEQLGYTADVASNPEDALLWLDAVHFDVVITDALMPKMDGREMCRRLKQTQGNRVKVILMTSLYTASRFKTEARSVFRVDEYLTKPLKLEDLQKALAA